jgi:hypothetical protein
MGITGGRPAWEYAELNISAETVILGITVCQMRAMRDLVAGKRDEIPAPSLT